MRKTKTRLIYRDKKGRFVSKEKIFNPGVVKTVTKTRGKRKPLEIFNAEQVKVDYSPEIEQRLTARKQSLNDVIKFRNAKGQFVSAKDRYSGKVEAVDITRRGKKIRVYDKRTEGENLTPSILQQVTEGIFARNVDPYTGKEKSRRKIFELLPAVFEPIEKIIVPGNVKYSAFWLGNKIAELRGIRGKLLHIILLIKDGDAYRKIDFYHRVKKNKHRRKIGQKIYDLLPFQIYKRINEGAGMVGLVFYKSIPKKGVLLDRVGKKEVKLIWAIIEKLIQTDRDLK